MLASKLKRGMPVWTSDGIALVTRITRGTGETAHLVIVSLTKHPTRGDYTTVFNRSEDLPQEKPREIRKAKSGRPMIPVKRI